jgi:tellurite resistance protein
MDGDLKTIAALVRQWAAEFLPGEPKAAETALAAALRVATAGGAVDEAMEAARRLLEGWAAHPSRPAGFAEVS